jgi:hypothetical protein
VPALAAPITRQISDFAAGVDPRVAGWLCCIPTRYRHTNIQGLTRSFLGICRPASNVDLDRQRR